MQVTSLAGAKSSLESALACQQQNVEDVGKQVVELEGQVSRLEQHGQGLVDELETAQSARDSTAQTFRAAQEKAAGLAAELDTKDCRLRLTTVFKGSIC